MSIWSFWTRRRTRSPGGHHGGREECGQDVTATSRSSTEFAAARAGNSRGRSPRLRPLATLDIVHRELADMHSGHIKLDPAIQTAIVSQATDAVVVGVLAELRSSEGGTKTIGTTRSRNPDASRHLPTASRGAVKWRARRKSARIHLSIPDCGSCRGIIDRAIVARAGGRVGGVSNAVSRRRADRLRHA